MGTQKDSGIDKIAQVKFGYPKLGDKTTPRPWHNVGPTIYQSRKQQLCVGTLQGGSFDDTSLIVKAVNSFSLLVDALHDIMDVSTIEEAKRHAKETLRKVQEGI